MPEDDDNKKQLFIVPRQRRTAISVQDFIEPGTQGLLFPTPKRGLILFVYFPDVNEREFRDALKSSKPSYVIELRTSPRFDIGGLTRQDAFQAFKVQNISYCDLTSSTMGAAKSDGALDVLKRFLREARIKFDRPIVFLVVRAELNPNVIGHVMQALTEYSPEPKIVFEVPHFEDESLGASRLAYL